jgi:chromosome segregation ATPase
MGKVSPRVNLEELADAVLEAERWKEVARSYRTRLLREISGWRRRAEQRLETIRQRDEEIERLADELEKAEDRAVVDITSRDLATLRRELADTKKTVEQANARADRLEHVAETERKKSSAAQEKIDRAEARRREAERKMVEHVEQVTMTIVRPIRANLRVLGARLGIDPKWPGYEKDEDVARELDRRLLDLQKRAGDV